MSTSTNSNAPFVLFYSKFCSHCRRAMDILKTHPVGRQMVFLCIDDKKGQLPPAVRAVPTIYDRRTKQYHVGEATFHFLQIAGQVGQQQETQAQQQRGGQGQAGPSGGGGIEGPDGYQPMEMNGFSDRYSYIDSADAAPKAFTYLLKEGGYGPAPSAAPSGAAGSRASSNETLASRAMTPSHGMARMGGVPESRNTRDEKSDNKDLESAYEALLASRKMDMPMQFVQRQ